jgi:hypothetical protein
MATLAPSPPSSAPTNTSKPSRTACHAALQVRSRLRIAGAKAIFTQDVVLRGGRPLPLYARVAAAEAALAIVLPCQPGAELQVGRGCSCPGAELHLCTHVALSDRRMCQCSALGHAAGLHTKPSQA